MNALPNAAALLLGPSPPPSLLTAFSTTVGTYTQGDTAAHSVFMNLMVRIKVAEELHELERLQACNDWQPADVAQHSMSHQQALGADVHGQGTVPNQQHYE